MSNDLIAAGVFGKPSTAFDALPDTPGLDEGIGQSYGILSYKGKVWSLRYQGQTHYLVRMPDGTPAVGGAIDVIIANSSSHLSKSYFPNYNQDNEGAPLCHSMNGEVPDPDVQKQQSPSCATCPQNQWKPDARGKKSKACSDYRRVAVFLSPALTQKLLGQPLIEPVFLRVPPASLKNLAALAKAMREQGFHKPQSFVTQISFDPTQSHPQMVFKAIAQTPDTMIPLVLEVMENPLSKRICFGDLAVGGSAMSEAPKSLTTVPQTASPSNGSAPTPTTAPASSFGMADAPPATQPGPTPAASPPASAPITTGFGSAEPAGETQKPNATSTVSSNGGTQGGNGAAPKDTGEPTLADAALDARIAALMQQ